MLGRQQRAVVQAQLQALFEQAPVAIGILQGADYVVRVANASICALWGIEPAQVLGRPLFEALPEVAEQGGRELLDGVRHTGTPFVAHELPVKVDRRGRREKMYFNFVYQPIRWAEGSESAVAIVATDVSQQVAARQQVALANEELQTANQQLTRTNADLDNFILCRLARPQGAHHQYRGPAGGLAGAAAAGHAAR